MPGMLTLPQPVLYLGAQARSARQNHELFDRHSITTAHRLWKDFAVAMCYIEERLLGEVVWGRGLQKRGCGDLF